VLVFYGSPVTHSGNELFDDVYQAVFGGESSNVSVIHDTRAGLARAIRGLSDGAAVVIMPDVHKHEKDAYLIPFCGRPLNVMLGTAALARRTGAIIVPAVSLSESRGFRFRTRFCQPIDLHEATTTSQSTDPAVLIHQDYKTTSRLFETYERSMAHSIIHWQYVRAHYRRKSPFPILSTEQIETAAELLFDDVRVRGLQQPAIPINGTPE